MEHRVVLDHREPVETASRRRVLDGGADREPGRESRTVVRHGDVSSDEFSRTLAPRDGGAAARVVLPPAHLCGRRVDSVEVLTQ